MPPLFATEGRPTVQDPYSVRTTLVMNGQTRTFRAEVIDATTGAIVAEVLHPDEAVAIAEAKLLARAEGVTL